MASFGDWVRERREAIGFSQEDLARRAKISKPYVGRIERSSAHTQTSKPPAPSVQVVDRIAKALGESPQVARDLAYGPSRPHPKQDEEIDALFYDYKELTEADKKELRVLIDSLRVEIRKRKLNRASNPQTSRRAGAK